MLALVGWETLPVESNARYPRLELDRTMRDIADLHPVLYRFLPEDVKAFAREYDCPLEKLRLIDEEMTWWYGSRAIDGLDYLVSERKFLK